MFAYSDNVVTSTGQPVVGASILVTNAGGQAAAIYGDAVQTPLANPFATGQGGTFSFYAPTGIYTLTVSGAGFASVAKVIQVGLGSGTFSDQEVPAGTVDGFNRSFVLDNMPFPPSSCTGVIRQGGRGAFLPLNQPVDFTLAGNTVTLVNAPAPGSNLAFSYRY